MVKCSFCGHQNPEGRTSCENCRSDLSTAAIGTPPTEGEMDVPTLQLGKLGMVKNLSRETPPAPGTELPKPASEPEVRTPTVAAEVTDPAAAPAAQKAKLVVVRGEKLDMQYPLWPGKNYLGRMDETPVDIDLECQEPADRIWTSRQHAVISVENGVLTIEDLNSLNGTFVNRTRVHPGQVRTLQPNDIIQVCTVQLRVVIG